MELVQFFDSETASVAKKMPWTIHPQLLLLSRRLDNKKITDVLLLMEKENFMPSRCTFHILIDTKGQSNDITGMEQIVEAMKGNEIEPYLLRKAINQNQLRPVFSSFMSIMDHYSNRGDVHNSEKIFHRKQAGHVTRLRQFQALFQAYINAKALSHFPEQLALVES